MKTSTHCRKGSLLLLWSAMLALVGTLNVAAVTVRDLRSEYLINPLGLDQRQPRLSWKLQSDERAQSQSAYQIRVASSATKLAKNEADLWDSGKVVSDQSLHVRYAGPLPAARQTCFWQVRVWDQQGGASDWSPVARWEMGLPDATDWEDASWIHLTNDTRHSPLTKRTLQTRTMEQPRTVEAWPSPLFRREFELRSGITRARAYVCGLGYAEMFLNGQRVGDTVLDPGQTTYDVRAFYVTHDITTLLRAGRNAVGVMVGNGFFGQNHAFNVSSLANGQPVLRAKIVVDYADGTTQVIATDPAWKAETGPILYDNVYAGETYDARRERSGWTNPGFDDSAWASAVKVPSPTQRMVAQMIPPIREMDTLKPVRVFPGADGKWLFDLGRNIAGWPRLKVRAPAGTTLTLKCAEVLLPDGQTLDHATTGVFATGVEQTEIYVCKGGGVETWQPRFTYHGFRYVEVEGLAGKPAKNFLEGVLVHTDVARAGSFECSDATLNRIYQVSLWTIEDNIHSTLEDCPHREKCGWLGDAHSVGETALFNYEFGPFFTKFVDDIESVLGRGGVTYWGAKATPGMPCNIAVGRRLCQEARPDWGAAYVLLPWYLQQYLGDTELFARQYEHLQRWIEHVETMREDGIVIRGYGDWCPPGGNTNMECPPPLTSTAFHFATLGIMADFARQLDHTNSAADYTRRAAQTRADFNRKFFDTNTGGYGSQTANAVALRFNLPPDGERARVARALRNEVVARHNGHAFVGIHGGRPLYTQLCEAGYEDVAIAAMKQETWPSLAYALAHGQTTWPEQMDEQHPVGRPTSRSLNHPMQSGFAAWFHESLGGIRPAAPGFKRIELRPHGFTQLQWAKAAHESPYGKIRSEWKVRAGVFHWTIEVPPNTTAIAHVPAATAESVREGGRAASKNPGIKSLGWSEGRASYELPSGRYQFESRL